MNFAPNSLYHIYNKTFGGRRAFLSDANYFFFINKLSSLTELCDILAYCIMPDHFHLLLNIPEDSQAIQQLSTENNPTGMQTLSRKIGTMLSSYTQAFNKQEKRFGSLFQPRTNSKLLDNDHAFICFHYIHQNPLKVGLVYQMEEWKFSSFNEYYKAKRGCCNKALATSLLGLPKEPDRFYDQSYEVIGKSF